MKVIKRIGQGGFGNVDHVKLSNGKEYARKTFAQNQPLSPELLENVKKRFIKEIKVQSAINHPNVVKIISSDIDVDPPYYLMPLAVGSMYDDIASDKTLGGKFISVLSDIVAALEELHSMGIYHRDLKPHNVLRFEKDGIATYAISDFGLISMKETNLSELTKSGMGKGSDFYTAPEIATDLRKASAQSDVYSLGCILHDIVGSEPRVPFREIREEGDFGAILAGCTKDDASKRFASAKAVLDAILTVEYDPAGDVSDVSEDFLATLSLPEAPAAPFWKRLADHLETKAADADVRAICGKLTAEKIEALGDSDADAFKRIGMIFADWVTTSGFNFELCDAIANRTEGFYDAGDLELKAECLMALLEMGTSHNRWYVERKFARLCGASMDENLAKRVVVRFHIAGHDDVCSNVRRLENSINFSRKELHPRLVKALADLCK